MGELRFPDAPADVLDREHKSEKLDPILVQRLSDRLMKGLLAHNQHSVAATRTASIRRMRRTTQKQHGSTGCHLSETFEMYDQRKKESLSAWRKLATQSQEPFDPQDQYDDLLKGADDMLEQGLISNAEWRQLVRDAGNVFTRNEAGASG